MATIQATIVPYLPQDNTESPQSEELVSTISLALRELLEAPAAEFWQHVHNTPSLTTCLGSYLQFCRRPNDQSSRSIGEASEARRSLARNVFIVLLRLVTVEDGGPGREVQAALLYGKWILDIPKLLDAAALYGPQNPEMTQSLMRQAFTLQPQYTFDLGEAAELISSNVIDVQRTCSGALEGLEAAHSSTSFQGLADGMAYLSDTFMTLASLCEAWPPAAHILIRKGSALLRALGTIFDDLLPGAAKAWSAARSRPTEKPTALALQRSLLRLENELQHLLAALLSRAYLRTDFEADGLGTEIQDASLPPSSLLVTLRELSSGKLLHATQHRFHLDQAFAASVQKGDLRLDRDQLDTACSLLGAPQTLAAASSSNGPSLSAKQEASLGQIREVLPGYGDGFLVACLDAMGQSTELVIHQLLEGSLPAELAKLDPKMPLKRREPMQQDSLPSGLSGNGVMAGSAWREMSDRESTAAAARIASGPALSHASQPVRVHKGTAFALRATPADTARAKLLAQAAQWEEYDDEYDDSFDDLAAFEADTSAATQGDESLSGPGPSQPSQPQQIHVQPKGGKALWVLNGRVYNYRKEGATPVPNQAAAEEAVRAQKAAAEAINGLGAGGNRPPPSDHGAGPPGMPAEAASQAQGPSRGRGGRGRGRGPPPESRQAHAFKNEHKAAIGNHHRKDRALRKMGGPAG